MQKTNVPFSGKTLTGYPALFPFQRYKRSPHEKKRLCDNRKYGHVLRRLWRGAEEAGGFAGAVGRAGDCEGKGVDFSVAL